MANSPTVQAARQAAEAAGAGLAAGWEAPAPLGASHRLLPFPVAAFPPWLAAEVTELARFTQTPADLAAVVVLAVLAGAAGGRAVIEVRGSWTEPLNLFTVAAMAPGSRKSAVFAELTAPLLAAEKELVACAMPGIREAAAQRKIAQKAADKAITAAADASKDKASQATADAISAVHAAETAEVPAVPRLVADDVTPEAAASLLAEQDGALAVLSAEGGIFATIAGRYSGGMPNFEVFLKGHSGDMLRVDRKTRPPEHIDRPALTLGLCVQPDVLREIAAMPGFRGRGLLARILYTLPPDTVGGRNVGEPPVPAGVRAGYAAAVRSLTLTLAGWAGDPAVLTLSPGRRRCRA